MYLNQNVISLAYQSLVDYGPYWGTYPTVTLDACIFIDFILQN